MRGLPSHPIPAIRDSRVLPSAQATELQRHTETGSRAPTWKEADLCTQYTHFCGVTNMNAAVWARPRPGD